MGEGFHWDEISEHTQLDGEEVYLAHDFRRVGSKAKNYMIKGHGRGVQHRATRK